MRSSGGLFRRPPRPGGRWSYETVAQTGTAWRLRFRFAPAPIEVTRLERSGRRLRGEGTGQARLRLRKFCPVVVRLPFDIRIDRLRRHRPVRGVCPD